MVTRSGGQQTMTGDPALSHYTAMFPRRNFARERFHQAKTIILLFAVTWPGESDDCADDNDDDAWDDAEHHLR